MQEGLLEPIGFEIFSLHYCSVFASQAAVEICVYVFAQLDSLLVGIVLFYFYKFNPSTTSRI